MIRSKVAAPVVASVLGPTRLDVNGTKRDLRSVLQRRLVAVLALGRPNGVTADVLIDAIWHDSLPANPRGALLNQVSRLRSALADVPAAVETTSGGYRLSPTLVTTDVELFESAVRRAQAEADPAARAGALNDALAGWGGDPYPDLDTDAAAAEAVRLTELRLNAHEDFLALRVRTEPEQAIAELEKFCASTPLRERPRVLLARALAHAGRRPDALRVVDDYRRLAATELGIPPSPELRRLYDELLTEEFPPRIRLVAGPPRVLDPVFGRDADVAGVIQRLDGSRLMTLTGPGGVGKSVLALLVASAVAGRFQHGVGYVDLVGADDAVGVAAAFVRSLDIEVPDADLLAERLTEALSNKDVLLIVDNAEGAPALVAPVLAALAQLTPHVRALVTSREPLNVAGEHLWPVEPLPSGSRDAPAVQLFISRVRAQLPAWQPADADVERIVTLCDRLDGLPLAIELAAAQLRVRSLREVSAELDEPFPSLDRPGASTRHSGLRSVLETSYHDLPRLEQAVFDRLSVFVGGFTRRSALDSCADIAPAAAVHAALDLLVHKSLVRLRPSSYGARYGMLDTFRRFGILHLTTRNTADAARRGQAQALIARVIEADEGLGGPDESEWTALLDDERADIHVALRTLLDADPANALQMVRALYFYAFPRGHDDVRGLAEITVRSVESVPADAIHHLAAVHGTAAEHVLARGDVAGAASLVDAGLALWDRDPYCHGVAGDIALFNGDAAAARRRYSTAACGHEAEGRSAMAAWLHAATALAAVYFRGTDALDAALGAREQADRTACPSAMAFARYVAAEARAHDGDAAAAHAELVDSLRLAEQVRAAFVAGLARLSLATLAVRVGNAWESLEHYEALLDMWRRSGNWVQQWNTLRTLVVALAELGRYDDAVQLLAGIDANAQTPRWGEDDARLVSADRKARQALGADRFAAAVEAGSGLSGIAVLEFAETCVARARRST